MGLRCVCACVCVGGCSVCVHVAKCAHTHTSVKSVEVNACVLCFRSGGSASLCSPSEKKEIVLIQPSFFPQSHQTARPRRSPTHTLTRGAHLRSNTLSPSLCVLDFKLQCSSVCPHFLFLCVWASACGCVVCVLSPPSVYVCVPCVFFARPRVLLRVCGQ